ncbi:MAG: hypothetical protein ACR2PS_08615 [Pseudomonadales bacterium]
MQPRCFTYEQAAKYCGISVSAYRKRVAKGLLPGCMRGTRRIDRIALDRALDKIAGLNEEAAINDKAPKANYAAWKAAKAG